MHFAADNCRPFERFLNDEKKHDYVAPRYGTLNRSNRREILEGGKIVLSNRSDTFYGLSVENVAN